MAEQRPGENLYPPGTGTLERDYDTAKQKTKSLFNEMRPNHRVADPDYLTPSLRYSKTSLPLSDPEGAFMYFLRIRDALKIGMETGRIPKELAPPRAPDYINEIVEGE